jgi:hypothetical protein
MTEADKQRKVQYTNIVYIYSLNSCFFYILVGVNGRAAIKILFIYVNDSNSF